MAACRLYGVGVRVNRPLAGLKGLGPAPAVDISIEMGALPPQLGRAALDDFFVSPDTDSRGVPSVRAARLDGGRFYRLAYDDGTRVVVSGRGDRIWAQTPEGATLEDTGTYLLGPALGFALRLRGVTCLHASAVAIDGRAVAFVGGAGAGKSSTAAAFARAGFAVLTDDVAALVDHGDSFEVQPAYPRLRLWPDSAEALFGHREALPRITPTWDKRYLALDGADFRFQREALPLAAIYLLGEREAGKGAPRCEAVEPRQRLMALVAETYSSRWIERAMRAREFEVLGRLVERVPVRRAVAHADMRRLPGLCAAVAADLRAIGL